MNNINSEVFRYNQKLQGPATAGTGGCDKKSETIRLLSKNNLANSLMGFLVLFRHQHYLCFPWFESSRIGIENYVIFFTEL